MTHSASQVLRGLALAIAAQMIPATGEAQDYSATCRYFSNVAFKDSRVAPDETFRMQLSQDCAEALGRLGARDTARRAQAALYLDLLQAYRATLTDLLLSRLGSHERTEEGHRVNRYVRPVVTPVSRSGAYLIARRMGVVAAHRDWAARRETTEQAILRAGDRTEGRP